MHTKVTLHFRLIKMTS